MLTRAQVARRLGKSVATVRRMEGAELHPTQDVRGVHWFDPIEVETVANVRCHVRPARVGASCLAAADRPSGVAARLERLQVPVRGHGTLGTGQDARHASAESERPGHVVSTDDAQDRERRRLVAENEALRCALLGQILDWVESLTPRELAALDAGLLDELAAWLIR